MSLAHELRVLDLESQIDLLDRLRLLTRFGSNLTNISGIKGSGKSWIAQRYLEAWSQDKNQSLLMCHPSQTDDQQRSIILNQVTPNPLFNEQDTISDSFFRLMEEQTCDVVIVVDDAQLLSETILSELWILVREAQTNPAWNINVVLFTHGDKLDAVLARLSYGQETKPLALEIEALTDKEVELFVELLVVKYVAGEEAKRLVRVQAIKTPPLPGALMNLGERKVEKRIIIRSIIGSPLKIAVLVLALLLLIAGGYFWLFNQPEPTHNVNNTTQVDNSVEKTALPVEVTQTDENNQTSPTTDMDETSSVARSNIAEGEGEIDDTGLPPAISDNVVSVGQSDDGQRVVVPSVVVDALLEGNEANTQMIDDAIKAATVNVTDAAKTTSTPDLIVSNIEPVAPNEDEKVQAEEDATPRITFSFAKEELMAIPEGHYTLQLAALISLADAQNFVDLHSLQNKVRIYPTLRDDTQWYIVTYKDFPTIQSARNAREELPVSVQQLDPWAKSMLQVHREIESAN